MNLKELKEAVDEYRRARAKGLRYEVLAHEVADSLTDPTPLSQKVLEGMGFVVGGPWKWEHPTLRVYSNYLQYIDGTMRLEGVPVHPQPRTVGDLWQLLLRLSREQS